MPAPCTLTVTLATSLTDNAFTLTEAAPLPLLWPWLQPIIPAAATVPSTAATIVIRLVPIWILLDALFVSLTDSLTD